MDTLSLDQIKTNQEQAILDRVKVEYVNYLIRSRN